MNVITIYIQLSVSISDWWGIDKSQQHYHCDVFIVDIIFSNNYAGMEYRKYGTSTCLFGICLITAVKEKVGTHVRSEN